MKPADDNISRRKGLASETAASSAITHALLRHVGDIVRDSGAAAVFVYADALQGQTLDLSEDLQQITYYITKTSAEDSSKQKQKRNHLRVPNVSLTRLGQVKIAVFAALSRGLVKPGDVIVCLSGMAATGSLDTVVVMEVGREWEMFTTPTGDQTPAHTEPGVVEKVVEIASALGAEGREGKPAGALFVLGDTERVRSLSRPLILNPFHGYPEADRNILSENLEETVKELCSIDGAFLIRGDGVVEAAGVYLKTASQEEFDLPRGLGARHQAAAAITSLCDCLAVAVSESTGKVTIFRSGRIITQLDKPNTALTSRVY
ncbi:MAG: diadenylate cyclase [Phycisphaeraceae bacterium]|nr:diadenylate cyclase [Phycisphaeraceae bacterium]